MTPAMDIQTVEPDPKVIGQRLKQAIGATPYAEVAAALGVSVSTLHRFLKGESDPDFVHIIRAANLFDRPLDWFVGGKDAA